jgi:ABC-type branched-subunit amino acid transport system substrate-binding protein
MGKRFATALAALMPMLAAAQILIGQTAGFSGPVAGGVKETAEGARLWLDNVNAKGGLHGRKIEVISLDDRFEPARAAQNARTLVEENKVVALFLTRGTPHTEAVLPILEQHDVPLVAPSTGAMSLHAPVNRHVFNVRATYQREAEKAVLHLQTVGIQRIAVVHADDAFGADAVEGANKGFAKAGIQPVLVIKADRGKPDFARIIPALVQSKPQAVLWLASGSSVADGVRGLRAAGSTSQVVTLSNNASGAFIKSLGEYARGVIVTQVFPYERSYSYRFIHDALALAKDKGIAELTPAHLEGFAAARVLVEALRRAGPDITRARLQSALEALGKFDLGGLDVKYSAAEHSGLSFADLSIIGADGRFHR